MNIEQYQNESQRTCPSIGSLKLDLSHMVLGLGSEISELQEAVENEDIVNVGEELTDMMWYLGNYNRMRGYKLKKHDNNVYYNILDLTHAVSTLQDYVKKFIAYGKEIDIVKEKETLKQISEILYSMYKSNGLDMDDCLQKNIDKLKARYPHNFDAELAVNRDLTKEREILEGYYGNQ